MWAQRQEDIYRLCIIIGLRSRHGTNTIIRASRGVDYMCQVMAVALTRPNLQYAGNPGKRSIGISLPFPEPVNYPSLLLCISYRGCQSETRWYTPTSHSRTKRTNPATYQLPLDCQYSLLYEPLTPTQSVPCRQHAYIAFIVTIIPHRVLGSEFYRYLTSGPEIPPAFPSTSTNHGAISALSGMVLYSRLVRSALSAVELLDSFRRICVCVPRQPQGCAVRCRLCRLAIRVSPYM